MMAPNCSSPCGLSPDAHRSSRRTSGDSNRVKRVIPFDSRRVPYVLFRILKNPGNSMPRLSLNRLYVSMFFGMLVALAAAAEAEDKPLPTESDYYEITTLPIPDGVVLEPGAIELLPDRRLAVATRRGEIYLVEGAFAKTPKSVRFQRFAHGLHELLGLAWRDGWLYVTQRCDVSRLKDRDGDDRADVYEIVNADWGITGDYHEYPFGSEFDRDGNLWVVLCLTGSFSSKAPYRGWCLRITPDGEAIPAASGIRSPGGIGMNHLGDMFYTDNQGPWNGTCSLRHLKPGSFQGHPAGNTWYSLTDAIGRQPEEPESGSRNRHEAVCVRAVELDRQGSVRNPRDAHRAGRLHANVHAPGRPADGRRSAVVPPGDLHLYLPGLLRQP